jgi:hypothetical protein
LEPVVGDTNFLMGERPEVAGKSHRAAQAGGQLNIALLTFTKRELAQMAVGTGETWVGQLPPDELRALFQLG